MASRKAARRFSASSGMVHPPKGWLMALDSMGLSGDFP
jgi:hypothetical protein